MSRFPPHGMIRFRNSPTNEMCQRMGEASPSSAGTFHQLADRRIPTRPVISGFQLRAARVSPRCFLTFAYVLLVLLSRVVIAETNSTSIAALTELTKPAKKIPFKDVILATTQHRILDFDTNNPAHVTLRKKILQAATLAGERARTNGLAATRANEAGNQIEPFVRAALRESGLSARVPVNASGDAQAAGYPDLEIPGDPPCYLELKTYSAITANTTQRSFYYSPSARPKVTCDALHFLLAFELEKTEHGGKRVFIPVHWKFITLENLQVDLKFEFNQSNRGLYGREAGRALLGEAPVKPPTPTRAD